MKNAIKRDRTTFKGPDHAKITKIWAVLATRNDWVHVAFIARQTGIHEATVRWYLDKYLAAAIEETHIDPSIRLRLVKLKPGIKLSGFLKAMELIKNVKETPIQTAFSPREVDK